MFASFYLNAVRISDADFPLKPDGFAAGVQDVACCSSPLRLVNFMLSLGIAEWQCCAAGLRYLTNWSGSQGERPTTCGGCTCSEYPSQGFEGGRVAGWVL